MKNKFLLILFIIVLNIKPAFCIEEAVFLNTEEIFQLKTQEAVNLQRVNQDHESIIERNYNYFESDEEIFESKTGKMFHKFIDDKIINNKINNFSTKIEEKISPNQ